MRRSVLLRRIILLLLSAVMLSGILSAGIYIFVTRRMYADLRAKELAPIARTVSALLTDARESGGYGRGALLLLDQGNKNFLGASLNIYNAQGGSLMNPPGDIPRGGKSGVPPEDFDREAINAADLAAILAGGEVSGIRKSSDGRSYLLVGVPIQDGDAVIGAVVFTKPLSELSETANSLNLTLAVSTLAAFLIMLVPGWFAAKRLVVPIRQMRDVAQAMARGDFTVRADASQKGEIGELGRSMNHFAAESGRLEQTRRDYVANVSHELRTPIAAIRAMGETLRDGMAKTDAKKELFYSHIVRESMRLSRLVDDLLELSRLQSGTEAMQKQPFDLREVVRNAAEVYSHIADEAGLRFVLAADMDAPAPVFSNPDRVEQVLVILLDNAIKHTPPAGAVTLRVTKLEDHAELCVANAGEGVPEEDLPYIFERFYTVDKSHSGGGTGLGLSIAREILRGLDESIRVEAGGGETRFLLTVHTQ